MSQTVYLQQPSRGFQALSLVRFRALDLDEKLRSVLSDDMQVGDAASFLALAVACKPDYFLHEFGIARLHASVADFVHDLLDPAYGLKRNPTGNVMSPFRALVVVESDEPRAFLERGTELCGKRPFEFRYREQPVGQQGFVKRLQVSFFRLRTQRAKLSGVEIAGGLFVYDSLNEPLKVAFYRLPGPFRDHVFRRIVILSQKSYGSITAEARLVERHVAESAGTFMARYWNRPYFSPSSIK